MHERPARVPRARVDDDARGLVHDEQMLVLVGDAEIELLGLQCGRPALRHLHLQHVAGRKTMALRLPRAVDAYALLGEEALRRRPRAHFLERREEAVQALPGALSRDLQLDASQASSGRDAPKECA